MPRRSGAGKGPAAVGVASETTETVWLSGGTLGDVRLTLRVSTAGGRTYEEGVKLKIKTR